jgi:hypothetical protein
MANADLLLSFESNGAALAPSRSDARPLLAVFVSMAALVEELGGFASGTDGSECPFVVTLEQVRAISVQYAFGFAPRYTDGVAPAEARRIGLRVLADVPMFLAARESGPPRVMRKARSLAQTLLALPITTHAFLQARKRYDLSAIAKIDAELPIRSRESFRAKIMRAGGRQPRVQLFPVGARRPCVLEADQAVAARAGGALYAEADVTAELERSADGRILHGKLERLRVLDAGDPVRLLDEWYAAAGKPWSHGSDIAKEMSHGHA